MKTGHLETRLRNYEYEEKAVLLFDNKAEHNP